MLTIVLVVGDVPWCIRDNDDGQHDEAEDQHEDYQVKHDQEPKERKVREDPCAEHPW